MEQLSPKLTHAEIGELINTKGIGWLRQHINLDNLNKDETRSIIVRLTGTPQGMPSYSKRGVTLVHLRNHLLQHGFHR